MKADSVAILLKTVTIVRPQFFYPDETTFQKYICMKDNEIVNLSTPLSMFIAMECEDWQQ